MGQEPSRGCPVTLACDLQNPHPQSKKTEPLGEFAARMPIERCQLRYGLPIAET